MLEHKEHFYIPVMQCTASPMSDHNGVDFRKRAPYSEILSIYIYIYIYSLLKHFARN